MPLLAFFVGLFNFLLQAFGPLIYAIAILLAIVLVLLIKSIRSIKKKES